MCAEVGAVVSCSRSGKRWRASPVGGSRSSKAQTSSSRSGETSRRRAASLGLKGAAAAYRRATRWLASSASAHSPGCSSTRVEPSSARRWVRSGSSKALDTCSNYKSRGKEPNYDNQAGKTEQRSSPEASRIEIKLNVVLAGGQSDGSEDDVCAENGYIDAVDAGAPAWIPGFTLQQVAGLCKRHVGVPMVGGCHIGAHRLRRPSRRHARRAGFDDHLARGVKVRG